METNPARFGCRHLAEDEPLPGVYRPPLKPNSSTFAHGLFAENEFYKDKK